ncbi:fatty acyl-CoA reductase wat [Trichonephila clavata]|uniref:Fatty acyl-CoA reductase wat n=1 Tax=Trichonephila clavata TaxID=2740835 RepID=A0A8X6ILA2_TRICU|nr:fatty acyl-CoA reductase wat [Trichonephila clavata]
MSDEQKESIKVARGRVKASLTRLENGVDNLNLKNEILIRLQILQELIADFERLDAELRAEESEIVDFEKRYFDLKLKFKDKIDKVIDASCSINVGGQNISIALSKE